MVDVLSVTDKAILCCRDRVALTNNAGIAKRVTYRLAGLQFDPQRKCFPPLICASMLDGGDRWLAAVLSTNRQFDQPPAPATQPA